MNAKEYIWQMTLDEKASLLSGLDFWHTKPVKRLALPGVMFSDGPHGLRKQPQGGDHLGVNGAIRAVCFPAGCALAASFDPALARKMGEALGVACQSEEVAVILGPSVNIKRSPLCGRNFEYYSEDPYLAGEIAVGYIQGVQSQNVGTSVKHFAVNSQEYRRMTSDSVVDERALREIYLPAFEAAVKRAMPWTVMCSYNRINGVYASDNRALLTTILRDEWGFKGLVVSDWGAVNDRVAGVAAGLDLEMPASGGENDMRVAQAVRSGELDEKDVDACAERVTAMTLRTLAAARPDTPWDKAAQHALAREIAGECIVLLKNEGNLLPLRRGDTIALIGPFAKAPRYQGGGSSHVNSFSVTGAWAELEGQPGILYEEGYRLDLDEPDEEMIDRAVGAAMRSDAAVIFAGLPDAFESEGFDRKHVRLPACQNALIQRVAAVNANTVVVLHNGSPVEMPWVDDARAVVEAYLGGEAVGGAVADVLFGAVNPSGRLPETFPRKLEDNPAYPWYGRESDETMYREGVFVGYRWYDAKNMDVLFPFGHGLSYTTFAYKGLRLSAEEIRECEELVVCVDVTNTGAVEGKEVVQLYVADAQCSVPRPVRELKRFAKVALRPGQTRTVCFRLDRRAFAFWDRDRHDWRVETGLFRIAVGRNSRDMLLEAAVRVIGDARLPKRVTRNTVFGDLTASPKAMNILKPLMDAVCATIGSGATTEDMLQAMLADMPLRGMLSFGGVTSRQLDETIRQINEQEGVV